MREPQPTAVVVEASGLNWEHREVRSVPMQVGPTKRVVTGPTETIREDGVRIDLTPIRETRVYQVPPEQVARMHAGLPTEIRREARVRFAALVKKLYADAERMFYKDGRVIWPKSITDEIGVLGQAQGKQRIVEQVEALARHYIVKGAREQQMQDSKRVTRTWHGHLSA